jgi:hypothetical protein
MLYRPSSLRKKATAFATAATLLGAPFGFTAASAEDATSNSSPSSTCTRLGPTDAGVHCAIKQMDKDIADAKGRSAAADKRAATADAQVSAADTKMAIAAAAKACLRYLADGEDKGRWSHPEILAQAGGKFTLENVCVVARKRGYEQKASLN